MKEKLLANTAPRRETYSFPKQFTHNVSVNPGIQLFCKPLLHLLFINSRHTNSSPNCETGKVIVLRLGTL